MPAIINKTTTHLLLSCMTITKRK
ncbi:hypothetical protein [Sicyoidochytrium minutum DNA virus]|nr:hypothetical protein [Sicyoidochytrium minutum DNA virus]